MSVFVIDASTVVSAALNPTGVPRLAVTEARARGTVALSQSVYQEIADVLSREKFARVLTADRRHEILELLGAAALWIEPREKILDCRDSKDNRYLELALAASATCIVSGDEDLIVLDPWRSIRVLRPGRFLEQLEQVKPSAYT